MVKNLKDKAFKENIFVGIVSSKKRINPENLRSAEIDLTKLQCNIKLNNTKSVR